MILNIDFNGYRFFEHSSLSFVADTRTKKLLANSSEIDCKNILKTVGLYGSNNSGKTNIVSLFSLVKKVLEGRERIVFNNPLFDDSEETNISIVFNNCNGLGWFKYEFCYNNTKMQYESEKLSKITYYDSGNHLDNVIFERNNRNKILNILGSDKSNYLSILPSRLPFLYSIEIESGDFIALKEYLLELQTFAKSIEIVKMYDIPIENTLNSMKNDDLKKVEFIKEFVKNADISISDFEFDRFAEISAQTEINEDTLSRIKDPDRGKLVTTYGTKKVPSIFFDSTGTKKIEALASYIYDALTEGKLLIIDELDNGLHYKLTRSIVSVFNNLVNEKSQLLFITHDLLLIDCNKLMRKDQIYFINRNESTASLFCLKKYTVNEGGPRDVSDIIKHYNRGEFGTIPNPSFFEVIVEVLNSGK